MNQSPHTRPLPLSLPSMRALFVACLLLLGLLALMPAPTALAALPTQETPADGTLIFQSAEMPSASTPGRVVTLSLDGAGGAIMSTDYMNGEDPIVEEGAYLLEGDQLRVTLTGRGDLTYEVPVEITFTEQADGSLEATEYDETLFGSEGLTLFPAEPAGDTAAMGADMIGVDATGASTVTEASLAGVYASETMPAASSPGIVMTLSLNEDGSATVSSDYLNDEPAIEEVGEWMLNDDGTVTLTLTGQADVVYDEPQAIELSLLPDGSLKTTSLEANGGEDITFIPVLGDPAGVYVSQIVPAASSPGMVVFMILYENGDVQASTYYLNNEPPVQETGTWAENVDSSVTVTVTASADRTYDQPQTLVFQRSRDTLSFLSLQLTKLDEMPPAGPEPTAWYQTDVMPAASSSGMQTSLILYDDGSVQMITDYMNGEPPIVEIGTFVDNGDDTITVSLTGQSDRDYNEADVITFAQDGDTLTATEYDETIYGSTGLTFTEQPLDEVPADESATPEAMTDDEAAAEPAMSDTVVLTGTEGLTESAAPATEAPATEAPATEAPAMEAAEPAPFEVPSGALGVYATDVLPAASSPGMQMRLVLFADNSAQMITDYMNGESPIIELGQWTGSADGVINLSLNGRITGLYDTPVEFVFERTDAGLNATEYDTAVYGNSGLFFNTEFQA